MIQDALDRIDSGILADLAAAGAIDTPAVATPEEWASLEADLDSIIREKTIDAAVRAFLKLHHPLSWRLWLQNRDKRQLISPLDMGDIRKLWRDQAA